MKHQASIRKIFLLIIALLSLSSCGLLHKVTDRKREHKTETIKKNIDSTAQNKSDSSASKKIDSAALKKSEEVKTSDIKIEFSDSSDHNKVEITTDSSGKQVVKAEGKIKAVRLNKTEGRKRVDSSGFSKKDTVSSSSHSSVVLKNNSNSKINTGSSQVHKDKKDRRLPWYGYLISIAVIILLTYWLYRKYKYNIIAWFIQLKNPGTKVYYDPKIKGYQIIDQCKTKNTS